MSQTAVSPDRHGILRTKHICEARQALALIALLQIAGGVFLYFDQRDGGKSEPLANWIVGGSLRSGAPAITRAAPGIGANAGGAVELVVQPGSRWPMVPHALARDHGKKTARPRLV